MSQVYIPGLGFRPAVGLAQRERTIIERGGQALAVMRFISTERGTEITVELKDKVLEEACANGAFDMHDIARSHAELRDARGRVYARTQQPSGMSYGQHEFGVFGRTLGFEPVSPGARDVVLTLHGALGEWDVPISLVPLGEAGATPRQEIDASVTQHGITVRVVGIAFTPTNAVVEFESAAPDVRVRGIGAEMQRDKEHRLVLIDNDGARYVEELSRETVLPGRDVDGPIRGYALFPAVAPGSRALTLEVPSVVIGDANASLDIDLPVRTPVDARFGPYPVTVQAAALVDDLLAPPGSPPGHGVRIAIGPADGGDGPQFVRAQALVVDGQSRHLGFGWHPDAGVVNQSVDLTRDATPTHVTLAGAVLRVWGPWRITFDVA